MTVQSAFDLEAFQRAYEEWDIPALLDLFAEDVELVQLDRDNPPSAPRMRRGRELLEGMFTHCANAGVAVSVEHAVCDERHGAASITCAFPGGRRVTCNSIFELRDGRIVRQHDVAIGDQAAG
jgi:ketosteroid isomerase-like protein